MKSYEKELLNLLEQKKYHRNNSFICPPDSPPNDDLKILDCMGLIKIQRYLGGGYQIDILPSALTYFESKRKDTIRTWFPICISLLALIISAIALAKP